MLATRSFQNSQATKKHKEEEQSRGIKAQRSKRQEPTSNTPLSAQILAESLSDSTVKASSSSSPVTIPLRKPSRYLEPANNDTISQRSSVRRPPRRSQTLHQKDALPPSVAALLAVTAIPPQRSARPHRRLRTDPRRISIDELVQEWRQEAASMPTVGSHKTMDILLESLDVSGDDSNAVADVSVMTVESAPSDLFVQSRSTSSDSIPSLDSDDRSLLSLSNPPTPGDRRMRRNSSFGKSRKATSRSMPPTEDTSSDHPLVPTAVPDLDIEFPQISLHSARVPESGRRKSSFKSNLTLSLQSLKSRALNSLSQLNAQAASVDRATTSLYSFSDQSLWQHPYLFPRLSSEIRPEPFEGTPTQSERRYFNPPIALNFDEQQGHFRQALHSPLRLSGDDDEYAPMIQMQTYSRSRSSNNKSRRNQKATSRKPDANSEAGRALLASGPPLTRQREPRENSDFLRVVVLEMNMRREGKLEETVPGRAKIWLPPRRSLPASESKRNAIEEKASMVRRKSSEGVPRRWTAIHMNEV